MPSVSSIPAMKSAAVVELPARSWVLGIYSLMVPHAAYACRHAASGLKSGLSLPPCRLLPLCGGTSPGRAVGQLALDMKRERQKVGCRRNIHDEDNMLPTYRTEPSAEIGRAPYRERVCPYGLIKV